jgi:prolyl-tRNA synthetase
MRTRLFLRTSEFLWQEGHTVHATEDEAMEETRTMLDVYADFSETYLAMPVIKGEKTEAERFPGAVSTYSIEAMMQDKKALQAGTSHFLGQNFAKSSSIKFLNAESKEEHAWTTSWGVSTRLVGGLIMTHSDDDGLVLPPAIAPAHVVILPVTPKPDSRDAVLQYCRDLKQALEAQSYLGEPVRVELDDRDIRGGEKTWSWVKKGVPIRIEVGPRDMEKDAVFYARRDKAVKDKVSQDKTSFVSEITALLENIQNKLFQKAKAFEKSHTQTIDNKEDFEAYFANEDAGYASVGFCLDSQLEDELAKRLKITVRCIPNDTVSETVPCIFTGKDGKQVIFARSY